MKRIVSLILMVLLLVSLIACGNVNTQPTLPQLDGKEKENNTGSDVIGDDGSFVSGSKETPDNTKISVAYEAKYSPGYEGMIKSDYIFRTKAELTAYLAEVDYMGEKWMACYLPYDEAFFENNVLIVLQGEFPYRSYPIVEDVFRNDQELHVSIDIKHVNSRQTMNSGRTILLSVSLADARDVTLEDLKCNVSMGAADWQAYDAACDLYGDTNWYKDAYGEKWYEKINLGDI